MRNADTGRFEPGESGNRDGRPPGLARVREQARLHVATAIHALGQMACDHGIPARDRRAACRMLLRLGWGRASGEGDAILADLGWLSLRDELADRQRRDEIERGDRARRIRLGRHGAR